MTPHLSFQHLFWQALWADPGSAPAHALAVQPGFAVYRNTVWKACADALLANHPAVLRLVGETWLRAAALQHVRHHPPGDPRLLRYGAGFEDTLARCVEADETLAWLPDVARLDRLWLECHAAADAPVLDAAALTMLRAEDAATARLVPHPAARWQRCDAWPAFSLWRAARAADADATPPAWTGEHTLFTRRDGSVQAHRIGAAALALLDACAAGAALPDALLALHEGRDADPGATLARLLVHGAFTRIDP